MPIYSFSKNLRIFIAFGFLAAAFLILIIGLIINQLVRYQFYHEQSENNRIRVQPIVPKRGLIYDRNMQIIADNRLSFTVSIVPFERVEEKTIPQLMALLEMDSAAIEKRAAANFISRYIPSPIKRGLGIETISILEEQASEYPGVTYSVESVRRYARNISAGTFVGHVGEVSSDEIKSSVYKDYRLGSLIGKGGIEKNYDRLLRGNEGTEYVEVSAKGEIIGVYKGRESIPAFPGADLVLTIDRDLQQFIVSEFDSLHYSGAVVAMNPRNGEVLALASFPHYDPNIFSAVIPSDIWQTIISDTNHPLLNRPLAGSYPPGSTTKPQTAGAALETGLVTADYRLKACNGGMQFGNRFFRCWNPGGHGRLNMYQAIEQSCDVYFYQLGQMLGVDPWSDYGARCGFGSKTGIDLPGEVDGNLPSSDYYDRVYGIGQWSQFLILNLAIGQGELTMTPLQLAQFYCGLANQGKVFRPHMLKEIIRHDSSIEPIRPDMSFILPFSNKTLDILNKSLRLVVSSPDGTAHSLENKDYAISGKTGTAQNPHGDNHSWFACYAPSEKPEIVLVALVEHAGHGAEVAAPLAGRILKFYMSPKNQEPLADAAEERPDGN